jgi:hypothetical protein
MRRHLFARCLIYLALLLCSAPGCQALQSYRPVSVLARDAETGKPIAGAEVRISYPYSQPSCAPWDSVGPTGADGIAHLRAAPYGDFDLALAATATGYLEEQKTIPVKTVEAIEPAHLFETVEKRPVGFILELYTAQPPPSVELIVPTGYRGVVEVEVEAREDVPCPPGQRCFRYEVPASGIVHLTGPVLLRHVWYTDYSAKYTDGTPLPGDARDEAIGFWFLQTGGRSQSFFVGTRREYENRTKREGGGPGRSSGGGGGGGGGGRGRRNRGGSQPPADAGP